MGIRGTFSKQCAYHTLHPANSYTHTNNFVLHKRWKKRRAYALGTEHKILDTVISLHFFSHQDHISRPSHIFFIKNATMSTPPPPPSANHSAITDVQTAAAASTTPALPLRHGAATALFSSSGKRHSTQDCDGAVSGAWCLFAHQKGCRRPLLASQTGINRQ